MLEDVMNIVRSTVADVVAGSAEIPEGKKEQAVTVATGALIYGLKNNFNVGNMSNLIDAFVGENSFQSTAISGNIQNSIIDLLIREVGLPQSVSATISTKVVSEVMSIFSGKINDPDEKEFDLQSLVRAFSGTTTTVAGNHEDTNILSGLKNIFGK